MSRTPNGWTTIPLDSMVKLKTGPFGSALHKADYIEGGTPIINPMHIIDGQLCPSSTVTVGRATVLRLAEFQLQPGDIVLGRRGEMGRCAVVTDEARGWLCGTGSLIVRASNKEILPAYLQRWLSSPSVVSELEGASVGSTMVNLNQSILRSLTVPLPPLAEQRRVVNKLDTVLARVDSIRARLNRVPALLKRFRQAVLAAGTGGTLTEPWRREQGISGEWGERLLPELGELGRGKSKHRPRNDPRLFGGEYPFIQTGAVAQSGGVIKLHTQTYSGFGLAQSKLWPAGTVCITIAANIADTAILTYPACFPDSVVGFVADPALCLGPFVKWSIDVIRDRLEAFAPATAQKNINLDVLRNVRISCPSLGEQTEIVRRVESLLALADALEAKLDAANAMVDRLAPALLSKAFRGELVPQDLNDEAADLLVPRARGEGLKREEEDAAKRRRGARATSKPARSRAPLSAD